MMMTVRALSRAGGSNDTKVENRSAREGFGWGAKKAIEKSWAEDGDDGVTMMAGKFDFSVARGKERSSGAGINV